jgi:NADH:ubiquinone oxidoreductase subunit E
LPLSEKIVSVAVCINRRFSTSKPSCAGRGSEAIADALESAMAEREMPVKLERIRCLGQCYKGPTVRFVPGGDFLLGQKLEDVPAILDRLQKHLS